MALLSRKGDKNQVGGKLMKGSSSVEAEFSEVATHPCQVTPHTPFSGKHKTAKTLRGSSSVLVDNKQVIVTGTPLDCGHSIVTGASSILIGD